ncbi:MAG: hypothetical protein ACYC2K_17260 [Gemmatimonadales bacterium]
MLVGHLAVALAAKKVEPRVPLGAAVAAVFGLDLLWPLLLLVGVESVQIHPGDTAFTNLAFESYPWSHSLLLSLGWSVLIMLTGRRLMGSWRPAAILGGLVLSHWVLDFITHRPDLPLWPAGPVAGLGLWNSVPGTILIEGGLLAAGVWIYLGASSARDRVGRWALAALVLITGGLWITQPWTPPPPSATAVAWGALILWLLPPWAHWIEQHRQARPSSPRA